MASKTLSAKIPGVRESMITIDNEKVLAIIDDIENLVKKLKEALNEQEKIDNVHCSGCYDDFYNHGGATGTTHECWKLQTAKLDLFKLVSIHQTPPWNQKPQLLPSCYKKQGYVTVNKDQTC
jgi:hypothetical protein